jgi:8-hydroxy-5-deazaflavin:NADPH oxidoreductase
MNVGMIGAGNVGRALTKASTRAGHSVSMSAESRKDAADATAEAGGTPVRSNQEAVQSADVVVLAVPFDAVKGIVDELGGDLDGKTVIDVTNRFSPEQLQDPSNAERIQEMAPRAHVIKAFNTILAANQSDPVVDGIALDAYVAGDDGDGKSRVLDFVRSLGFEPIDAGPLAMSRALEGMGTLNIWLNKEYGWPWASAWKLLGPTTKAA